MHSSNGGASRACHHVLESSRVPEQQGACQHSIPKQNAQTLSKSAKQQEQQRMPSCAVVQPVSTAGLCAHLPDTHTCCSEAPVQVQGRLLLLLTCRFPRPSLRCPALSVLQGPLQRREADLRQPTGQYKQQTRLTTLSNRPHLHKHDQARPHAHPVQHTHMPV